MFTLNLLKPADAPRRLATAVRVGVLACALLLPAVPASANAGQREASVRERSSAVVVRVARAFAQTDGLAHGAPPEGLCPSVECDARPRFAITDRCPPPGSFPGLCASLRAPPAA